MRKKKQKKKHGVKKKKKKMMMKEKIEEGKRKQSMKGKLNLQAIGCITLLHYVNVNVNQVK